MKIGLHVHKYPTAREDVLATIRCPIWTVLDNDIAYYRRFIKPGDFVVLRLYHPDVMSFTPEHWAGLIIARWDEWAPVFGVGNLCIQWANELKLAEPEHGGDTNQAYWDSEDGGLAIIRWNTRVAGNLKGRRPEVVIGGPFETPGHQFEDGRQEARAYAAAGFFDLVDYFGSHFYAEGPDRDGFDDPGREWFSDRIFAVDALLTELGYPASKLPRIISETNRKDVDRGDVFAEFDRYCARIAPIVFGVTWFIHHSPDAGFATFNLTRAPGYPDRYQALIDKYAGAVGPPLEPEPPEPPTPEPVWPTATVITLAGWPVDLETARAKYPGLRVFNGPKVFVQYLDEVTDGTVTLTAKGPADQIVRLFPTGDPTGPNGREGMGRAEIIMGNESQGPKGPGWVGPWSALCGDARVDGLGMVNNHHHFNVTFAERPEEPPHPPPVDPPPTENPMPTYQPELAFAGAYQAFWGEAISPLHYAQLDPRPADQRQAIQFFEHGVAYWNGGVVRFMARGTNSNGGGAASPAAKETAMPEGDGRDQYRKTDEEIADELIAGGNFKGSREDAINVARAVKNTLGFKSDAEAHPDDPDGFGQGVGWARRDVSDPNDPEHDASPNALDPNVPLDKPS